MKWFIAEYRAWPRGFVVDSPISTYTSFILARDLAHAKRLAKARNIGETLLGEGLRYSRSKAPYRPPSVLLRKRRLTQALRLDVIHATCFLSFLLMRVKGVKGAGVHAILGDEGIMHQVIHTLSFGFPRRKAVITALEGCERMVPGYWKHPAKRGKKR